MAQEAHTPLYLEDLHVGLRFECGTHALDVAQIKAFAREYDPQPFHMDEEAAKGTFFGGLAASEVGLADCGGDGTIGTGR